MHDSHRTANLLGATALAVNDVALAGATKAAGVSASGAAALVTLSAAPGLSVTELGRRVGLTQSAAARMVDSLENAGLVERRSSPISHKWTTAHLTGAGEAAARHLLAARGSPLTDVVDALAPEERAELTRLLEKLLTRLYEELGHAQYMCRLCDRSACTHESACPVGEAERAHSPPR